METSAMGICKNLFCAVGKGGFSRFSIGLSLLLLTVAAHAQTVTLSPTSLAFGNQGVGTTSAVRKVTLANTGTATLTISNIAISGPFAQTNTCGSSVQAGKRCQVSVTFSPSKTGAATGTLTITDNASNSPQSVSLTGSGVTGVTVQPTTLTFPATIIGTTSAALTATLANNNAT